MTTPDPRWRHCDCAGARVDCPECDGEGIVQGAPWRTRRPSASLAAGTVADIRRLVDLDALVARLQSTAARLEDEAREAETPEDRIRTEGAAGGTLWAITVAEHEYTRAHGGHVRQSGVPDASDCACEFAPYDPADYEPGEEIEESWHYRRTCLMCGMAWWAVHCPHDGTQNPCPGCGWIAPGKRTPLV